MLEPVLISSWSLVKLTKDNRRQRPLSLCLEQALQVISYAWDVNQPDPRLFIFISQQDALPGSVGDIPEGDSPTDLEAFSNVGDPSPLWFNRFSGIIG